MRLVLTAAALAVGMLVMVPVARAGKGGRGGSGRRGSSHTNYRQSNHRIYQNHHVGQTFRQQKHVNTFSPKQKHVVGQNKTNHLTHGKAVHKGHMYKGKNHKHWTHQTYWKKHKCYWDPRTKGWFYWSRKLNAFLSVDDIDDDPPDEDYGGADEDYGGAEVDEEPAEVDEGPTELDEGEAKVVPATPPTMTTPGVSPSEEDDEEEDEAKVVPATPEKMGLPAVPPGDDKCPTQP